MLYEEEDTRPYECDGLTAYRQLPMVVALPETEEQVQRMLQDLLTRCSVPVVPRGAGTGLSGGALPPGDGVLLSMAKFMRMLRDRSARAHRAWCSPACATLAISEAAAPFGLYYAPDPSSQIACTIGGNVAENSGGVHCLKYGLTRAQRAAACAASPSTASRSSSAARRSTRRATTCSRSSIGSEGMLAVVTEVTVKLLPKPQCARGHHGLVRRRREGRRRRSPTSSPPASSRRAWR